MPPRYPHTPSPYDQSNAAHAYDPGTPPHTYTQQQTGQQFEHPNPLEQHAGGVPRYQHRFTQDGETTIFDVTVDDAWIQAREARPLSDWQ